MADTRKTKRAVAAQFGGTQRAAMRASIVGSMLPEGIRPSVRPVDRRAAAIEMGGLLEVDARTVLAALAIERRGAADGGARQARVDLERLVEIGECAIIAALLEPDGAAVAVDLGIG